MELNIIPMPGNEGFDVTTVGVEDPITVTLFPEGKVHVYLETSIISVSGAGVFFKREEDSDWVQLESTPLVTTDLQR